MLDICKKYQVPFQMNAKDIITKILDPTSGISSYLGEQTLPYITGNRYAFKTTPPTTLVKSQTMYFDEVTKEITHCTLED